MAKHQNVGFILSGILWEKVIPLSIHFGKFLEEENVSPPVPSFGPYNCNRNYRDPPFEASFPEVAFSKEG